MRQARGRPPVGGERRQAPRWLDKRLVTVQTQGSEFPGMTGDLSTGGIRLGLPCNAAQVGQRLEINVAFAQVVLTVQCQLAYVRERSWGTLVGVRYAPGQDLFRRFLSRRYYQPVDDKPTGPAKPALEIRRHLLSDLIPRHR